MLVIEWGVCMKKIIFVIFILGIILIGGCASETQTITTQEVQENTPQQKNIEEQPPQEVEVQQQSESTQVDENIQNEALTLKEMKQQAKTMPYDDLMRENKNYVGDIVYYRGEVQQVSEISQNEYVLRVSVTEKEYFWDDVVWVDYIGSRVLEKDIIDLWGAVTGLRTYTAVLGNDITIPKIKADAVEVVIKAGDRTTEKVTLDDNREVLAKSSKGGVTLELNSLSFEEKGGWGKIKTIGITVINEMNDDLWPHYQVFVYDKENPDSDDFSVPKWDETDGWLEQGEFLSKEYPIDTSVSDSDRIKIIKVDLLSDTFYPRRAYTSVEFEADLREWT